MQVNWSLKREDWVPKVSKLFQIDLTFLDVRLVVGVSVGIFLVFLYYVFLFFVVFFF